MHRLSIVVPPPRPLASNPRHADLAASICAVWSCALYAAGADVFSPNAPLDPEIHPFLAVRGVRGRNQTHDGHPPCPTPDAIVTSELECCDRGWRLPMRLTTAIDAAPAELPGHLFHRLSAPLDAMAVGLHAIASTLGLEMPPEIGWRELLGARTVAEGLEILWQPQPRDTRPQSLPN